MEKQPHESLPGGSVGRCGGGGCFAGQSVRARSAREYNEINDTSVQAQ